MCMPQLRPATTRTTTGGASTSKMPAIRIRELWDRTQLLAVGVPVALDLSPSLPSAAGLLPLQAQPSRLAAGKVCVLAPQFTPPTLLAFCIMPTGTLCEHGALVSTKEQQLMPSSNKHHMCVYFVQGVSGHVVGVAPASGSSVPIWAPWPLTDFVRPSFKKFCARVLPATGTVYVVIVGVIAVQANPIDDRELCKAGWRVPAFSQKQPRSSRSFPASPGQEGNSGSPSVPKSPSSGSPIWQVRVSF